jgi:DNA-binding transcriptional regulator LsrR (DeoR family)
MSHRLPPPESTATEELANELTTALMVDAEEQLATRAAWHYFIAELTQEQIGQKLGITRVRVNRLLAAARERGLVQIRIAGKLANCVTLEQELVARFGLERAVVVPTPPDQSLVPHVIGAAAGAVLADHLTDDMSVGVGWGRTLRLSLRSIPVRKFSNLSVVSLLGGLTRGAAINPHESASHLADLLNAQCYYIAAPIFTDSEASKEMLMRQPMLLEVMRKAAEIDVAFLSVGDLSGGSTMARLGLISPEEIEGLRRAGAVGDLCGHWIGDDGRIVAHPLNNQVVALSPDRLKGIPLVILASGGQRKVAVLRGVLAGGLADVIVTDEDTAHGLLNT